MPVYLIRPENFAQEVVAEKKPVLLMVMPRDDQFPQQLKLIEDIAVKHGETIKVGVLQEDSIEAFKKDYGLLGTPTFMILVEGKERGRTLGLADQEKLTNLFSPFEQG